jgi:hypothetical protein
VKKGKLGRKSRKKYLENFGRDKRKYYLCRPKAKEFLIEFEKQEGISWAKAREGKKVL